MATKIGLDAAEVTGMNPWWREKTWSKRDQDLRAARDSNIGYEPDALDDLQPGALYLLRGPRRVGKTVAIKQTIKRLLDQGTPPLSIVRLAVDGWSPAQLRTTVQRQPLPPLPDDAHRWWFIDEITAVDGDWATQVKWLRDNHPEFANATVVLTGSSAAELTAGAGVLAGRRGRAARTDRTLLPMGFRTFASIWNPELADLPHLDASHVHTTEGEQGYHAAHVWLDQLVRLWELYLLYGGFPASVTAARAGEAVPAWFLDAIFSVIHRDAFASSQLDEAQTTALVARVWESTSTPISLRSVGDDVGLTHPTVARHLEYLRDAYLLWSCPQLDKEWVPNARAQDKIYPIDPLVGRLGHLRSRGRKDLDPTVLAESQLGMALRRAQIRFGGSWAAEEPLFYLRTPTRKEVDFVSEALDGAAVEGKYTDTGKWAGEAATVEASAYRGILATRSVLDTTAGRDGAWAVPAAVLAVMIDD